MNNGLLVKEIELNANLGRKKIKDRVINYEVMHGDILVAEINTLGQVILWNEKFSPYDLYLEQGQDFDVQINNLNNFYHWCSSRVLSLDRKYAKEILNSIGVAQAVTDRDRAEISLSYHCVSLTDTYWVKVKDENVSYETINLYDNPLNDAIVALPLRGKQMTVTNHELAPDLSTKGCFPKAWIRRDGGFILLKDGGEDAVKRELLASKICQCFAFRQVEYREGYFDGEMVTESQIITSKEYSIVSKIAFDIYASNHDLNTIEECVRIDNMTYYGMNIIDYLVGNTDRHPENWGFLVDNRTNEYVSIYPLMDFNQSFYSYDTIEGANCQTVYPKKMTQREAAVEAVKCVGLNQIKEIDEAAFKNAMEWKDMFYKRLNVLKMVDKPQGI